MPICFQTSCQSPPNVVRSGANVRNKSVSEVSMASTIARVVFEDVPKDSEVGEPHWLVLIGAWAHDRGLGYCRNGVRGTATTRLACIHYQVTAIHRVKRRPQVSIQSVVVICVGASSIDNR